MGIGMGGVTRWQCGGRCREVCWSVGMSKERCVRRSVGKCMGCVGKFVGLWGRDVGREMGEV